MYSHGPHIDVTDLELSPILGNWSDILEFEHTRTFGAKFQHSPAKSKLLVGS